MWMLRSPIICCLQPDAQENWCCNSVWVWRPENQGSQWCKSKSEGRRMWDEVSQLKQWSRKKRDEFLPLPPFVLFRPFGLYDTHPHWGGPSTLLFLIQKHPHRHAQKSCLIWTPHGQSNGHRKLTIMGRLVKLRQRRRLGPPSSDGLEDQLSRGLAHEAGIFVLVWAGGCRSSRGASVGLLASSQQGSWFLLSEKSRELKAEAPKSFMT